MNVLKWIAAAGMALALASAWVANDAKAANCSSYAFTLTNGQVADATQVMANFNNILSCANNNLAHNGANSDITSLAGLTTPLSAGQGGTGQATSIFSSNNTWTGTQGFSGVVTFATPTTSIPSINLPPGVAPSAPSNGDIWGTSAGVFARVNGTTLLLNEPTVIHVRHQRTTGNANNEAGFTTLSWNARALETVVTNTISGASVASNQITLPAGTYEARVMAPICSTNGGAFNFKHRLYNVTDAAVLVYGLNGQVVTGDPMAAVENMQDDAPIQAQITLAAAKAIRLETWLNASSGDFYNCEATGDGSPEVYTDIYIRKIG